MSQQKYRETSSGALKRIWKLIISPSFIALFSIVAFGVTIYTSFFYERRSELTFTTEALTKVFDVHQPVGGLEVSYKGHNLRESKETLWHLNMGIKNTGSAGIKKVDYDESSPLGIRIGNAKITEIKSIRTSNDYLRENISIKQTDHAITINPLIIEPNDKFDIILLLLSSEGQKPVIEPTGVIAGSSKFRLSADENLEDSKNNFTWTQVIMATPLVHVIRLLIYGAVSLAMTIGFLILFDSLVRNRTEMRLEFESKRRDDLIKNYKFSDEYIKEMTYLVETYKKEGLEGLYRIERILTLYKKRQQLRGQLKLFASVSNADIFSNALLDLDEENARTLREMQYRGLTENGEVVPSLYEAYNRLYTYLELHLPTHTKPHFAEIENISIENKQMEGT